MWLDFLSVSPRLEREVTFPTVRRQDPSVWWTWLGHSLWGVPYEQVTATWPTVS